MDSDYEDAFEGFTFNGAAGTVSETDRASREALAEKERAKAEARAAERAQRLAGEIESSLATLSQVGLFATGGIGFSGEITDYVITYKKLLEHLTPEQWISRALNETATPMLRAYAGAALASNLLNRKKYKVDQTLLDFIEKALNWSDRISVQSGCIRYDTPLCSQIFGSIMYSTDEKDCKVLTRFVCGLAAAKKVDVEESIIRKCIDVLLDPNDADLLSQLLLTKKPSLKLALLAAKARLQTRDDLDDIEAALDVLNGDIGAMSMELLRETIVVFAQRPRMDLYRRLLDYAADKATSYPIINMIGACCVKLLHEEGMVQLFISRYERLLKRNEYSAEALLQFLRETPKSLQSKRPTNLKERIVEAIFQMPAPKRSEMVTKASTQLPNELFELISNRVLGWEHFLELVHELWSKFHVSMSANLNAMLEEYPKEKVPTEKLQEYLLKDLIQHNKHSTSAYMAELRRRLSREDFLNLLKKCVGVIDVYHVSETLAEIRGLADEKSALAELLLEHVRKATNGHVYVPVIKTLLSFKDSSYVKLINDILEKRCKDGTLSWHDWGVRDAHELLQKSEKN